MRSPLALVLLVLLPSASFAQTEEIDTAIKQRLATIRYVRSLQDATTGAFRATADARGPGLRATSAGVRSLKYLTGKPVKDAVPNADKAAAFVLSCFDPKTGGFADAPSSKPDVTLTSVGVMASMELGVPKEKVRKAMDYLKEHAKTFEDVRIGAAAVEAWGVKDCPFDLKEWYQIRNQHLATTKIKRNDGHARMIASEVAFRLRLGGTMRRDEAANIDETSNVMAVLNDGQLSDGGWSKEGSPTPDLETSYRVMRALYLLKAKPKDVTKLRGFIGKCRNADGGYGVKPDEASTVGGVYYAAIITHWLDELEKK